MQQIVDLAVQTVEGCAGAGIFVVENEQVITTASTDELVVELDRLQFEADEGPCLDAVSEATPFYAQDLSDDPRWPRFGPAASAIGVRSLIAFPLTHDRPSALSLYGLVPDAFGPTDRAKGILVATLAGVALGTGDAHADEERAESLRQALRTRELIAQAQGILMERERITAGQALDVLRLASRQLHRNVREVAENLVETGETPDTAPRPPDPK